MIINAERLVLGRLAAVAAKRALLGEDVQVVNCEKALVTGKKRWTVGKYAGRLELGQPQQGPFIQRRPDLFVRRVIRGMIPRRRSRGKDAYSRVRCYLGVPKGMESASSLKEAAYNGKVNYITVGELCMHLGDNKR